MNSFSSANMAIVAYASVKANGSSLDMNSGIKTAQVSTGVYEITLPGDPAGQAPLQEGQEVYRDLILATVKNVSGVTISAVDVAGSSGLIKRIVTCFSPTTNPQNVDFDILILRTLISPPAGAPA